MTDRKFTPPTELPKRITTWHNVWFTFMSADLESREEADRSSRFSGVPRLCVYRIERDPDGGNPEIFVEEV